MSVAKPTKQLQHCQHRLICFMHYIKINISNTQYIFITFDIPQHMQKSSENSRKSSLRTDSLAKMFYVNQLSASIWNSQQIHICICKWTMQWPTFHHSKLFISQYIQLHSGISIVYSIFTFNPQNNYWRFWNEWTRLLSKFKQYQFSHSMFGINLWPTHQQNFSCVTLKPQMCKHLLHKGIVFVY